MKKKTQLKTPPQKNVVLLIVYCDATQTGRRSGGVTFATFPHASPEFPHPFSKKEALAGERPPRGILFGGR